MWREASHRVLSPRVGMGTFPVFKAVCKACHTVLRCNCLLRRDFADAILRHSQSLYFPRSAPHDKQIEGSTNREPRRVHTRLPAEFSTPEWFALR